MTGLGSFYTASELAAEVGVEPATIYTWTARRFLAPVDKRGRFNLYRLEDGFRAESTRAWKHRRKGTQ